MEGLTRLVSESMARHGLEVVVDHRRLQWSGWFRCESGFVAVPGKPGLFALGEELLAPGEMPAAEGKRMLAVLQVAEALDLSIAMDRAFASNGPLQELLASGRAFARYTVIEDAAQRHSVQAALRHWLVSSAETALGFGSEFSVQVPAPLPEAVSQNETLTSALHEEIKSPAPLPVGF